MNAEQARLQAKKMLSARRYAHVQNVAKAAVALAKRYGANEEKAELAAWLHDIVKEYSREDLLRLLRRDAIMARSTEKRPYAVWHGPAAAVYARLELGVDDPEVLDAVAAHTTGRAGMGKLDKVLYLADLISEEREYPGVEELRTLAQKDLDEAVIAAMRRTLAHVEETGKPLDPEARRALDAMCAGHG